MLADTAIIAILSRSAVQPGGGHMDEQPDDAGGRPKILNNMTALIGGTTALVVAVAGLMTATKDFW